MRLGDNFEVEKKGESFLLIEKYLGKDSKGNDKWQKRTSYYGVLYQALQAYLDKTVDNAENLSDLRGLVYGAVMHINRAKEDLKKEFCIEVRKEK